ncbi:MAG: GGDEF domain-containing protein [Microcystaceae cyanobacterium]
MDAERDKQQYTVETLGLQSRLKDLSLYGSELDCNSQARTALQWLNADPKLPGIILMAKGELVGMVSRRRILEQMSRPFGLELFLDRSLLQLYQYTKSEHIILNDYTLISEAVQKVLERSNYLFDEPLIVYQEGNGYALLDIHQLLIAHAKIFELTSNLLEKRNQELRNLAVIDPLTGIGNRRFFDLYFARDWNLAIRERQWISVVLVDVDLFKKYNDYYGHQKGDSCLRQIAATLQRHCKRATDIVARYGGEEFILSFLNTKTEQAIIVIEKIQQDLASSQIPHKASPVSDYVTLSFGIASIKLSPEQPALKVSQQRLIELADQALYQAKEAGRNQYAVMSPRKRKG